MPTRLTGKNSYCIGVISDTHGLLLPDVSRVFRKVDLIVHAGDIDNQKTLEELRAVAPLVAVRGNMDFGKWAGALHESETIEVDGLVIHVSHIVGNIPASATVHVVIYGHTHRSRIETQNGILFLNPGSAGQRRHGDPLSVAILTIRNRVASAEIIQLET